MADALAASAFALAASAFALAASAFAVTPPSRVVPGLVCGSASRESACPAFASRGPVGKAFPQRNGVGIAPSAVLSPVVQRTRVCWVGFASKGGRCLPFVNPLMRRNSLNDQCLLLHPCSQHHATDSEEPASPQPQGGVPLTALDYQASFAGLFIFQTTRPPMITTMEMKVAIWGWICAASKALRLSPSISWARPMAREMRPMTV